MLAAVVWLLISLGILAWNRRLARALVTANRAIADGLDIEWIKRWFFWWLYRSWALSYARACLIAVGVFWTVAASVAVALKA